MMPFPETETITVQRLEVALEKKNYALLKDGAYKLHEKFHSGHYFEYIDILRNIFMQVNNDEAIPTDIKNILIPTIQDIFTTQGVKSNALTFEQEFLNQNEIINVPVRKFDTDIQPQQKLDVFKVFGASKPLDNIIQNESKNTSLNINSGLGSNFTYNQNVQTEENIGMRSYKNKNMNMNISVFYGKDNDAEISDKISKYRKLLFETNKNDVSGHIFEVPDLITDITTCLNVNIIDLKDILDVFKIKGNSFDLITNSMSSDFIGLFNLNNIPYGIFDSQNTEKINFMPIFGLTNLYACPDCNEKYLDNNDKITPLILKCPKCNKPMFPELYTVDKKGESKININYYNQAFVSLSTAKVWFLIHPFINDVFTIDMLKSALKVNNQLEEIFISDKDVKSREILEKIFLQINHNIKINSKITVIDDFFNLLQRLF